MSIWVIEERDLTEHRCCWRPILSIFEPTKTAAKESATGRRQYLREVRRKGVEVRVQEYIRKPEETPCNRPK